jgi:hypothetical protein
LCRPWMMLGELLGLSSWCWVSESKEGHSSYLHRDSLPVCMHACVGVCMCARVCACECEHVCAMSKDNDGWIRSDSVPDFPMVIIPLHLCSSVVARVPFDWQKFLGKCPSLSHTRCTLSETTEKEEHLGDRWKTASTLLHCG